MRRFTKEECTKCGNTLQRYVFYLWNYDDAFIACPECSKNDILSKQKDEFKSLTIKGIDGFIEHRKSLGFTNMHFCRDELNRRIQKAKKDRIAENTQ